MSSQLPCFQILQLSMKIVTRQMYINVVSQCRGISFCNPVVGIQLHLFSVNKIKNGSYQDTLSIRLCNDFQVYKYISQKSSFWSSLEIVCIYPVWIIIPTSSPYTDIAWVLHASRPVDKQRRPVEKENKTLHLIHFPCSRFVICVYVVCLVGWMVLLQDNDCTHSNSLKTYKSFEIHIMH